MARLITQLKIFSNTGIMNGLSHEIEGRLLDEEEIGEILNRFLPKVVDIRENGELEHLELSLVNYQDVDAKGDVNTGMHIDFDTIKQLLSLAGWKLVRKQKDIGSPVSIDIDMYLTKDE